MSHYTVAVFTTENQGVEVEDLLQPYDENIKVPHYTPKAEIIASVRKGIEDYKRDPYAEYLKDPEGYIAKYGDREEHIKYITQEFPKKLSWSDEECYAEGIKYEDAENIRPDGSVFSDYNPNAKWDWYQICGRFADIIPLNDGTFCGEADMDEVNIDYRDEDAYKRAIR